MAKLGAAGKAASFNETKEGSSVGMIVNSRAMVEKDEFVATGMISAIEGDFVAIEIGEYMHFSLGDLVKITVFVPGGIRSFRSKIIGKDEGHLYIVQPPGVNGEEKREAIRVSVNKPAALRSMMAQGRTAMSLPDNLEVMVKNISSSGIGFVLGQIHRLLPDDEVELELELGTIITCKAQIVRRDAAEDGYFYGAKFTYLPEERVNSLRAFIIKEQVEMFSRKKQSPESVRKRVFR